MSNQQRRVTYYQGRVQGVGFRYTTQRVAGEFRVTGYVKNLPDGRVLMVAEGAAEELERFLRAIDAQMGRFINEAQSNVAEPTGEFKDFGIRY